jgi:glycosyltransferase involved in cell wall biosynthesis
MRVAMDALLYGPHPAGVGQYIGQLATAYAARFPEDELLLALPEGQNIPGTKAFHPIAAHAGSRQRLLYEHLRLPRRFKAWHYDVAHFPDYQMPWGGLPRSVLTVHDLVAFRYPDTFPPATRRVKQVLTRRSVRIAHHIIVPSEATRRDLTDVLNVDPARITVVWHGVTPPRQFAEHPPHPRPYFFFIGTLEPRKNLVRLIQAYRLLRSRHRGVPDLVIAGKPGWMYEPIYQEAARVDEPDRVLFLGYVNRAETWAWYRHAVAFCFPTLYEGFGMPLLEAMAARCRIITANRGAVAEVANDVGLLVDPEEPEAIAEAMRQVWQDPGALEANVARGVERAAAATWTRSAEQTRAVYERARAHGHSAFSGGIR